MTSTRPAPYPARGRTPVGDMPVLNSRRPVKAAWEKCLVHNGHFNTLKWQKVERKPKSIVIGSQQHLIKKDDKEGGENGTSSDGSEASTTTEKASTCFIGLDTLQPVSAVPTSTMNVTESKVTPNSGVPTMSVTVVKEESEASPGSTSITSTSVNNAPIQPVIGDDTSSQISRSAQPTPDPSRAASALSNVSAVSTDGAQFSPSIDSMTKDISTSEYTVADVDAVGASEESEKLKVEDDIVKNSAQPSVEITKASASTSSKADAVIQPTTASAMNIDETESTPELPAADNIHVE
eukprot:CFRG4363T1